MLLKERCCKSLDFSCSLQNPLVHYEGRLEGSRAFKRWCLVGGFRLLGGMPQLGIRMFLHVPVMKQAIWLHHVPSQDVPPRA